MRRKINADAFIGILALVVFIALALARSSQDRTATPSAPSSYDTGRYGYRAVYDLLAQEGIAVRRFQRNHRFLDHSIATLILAQSPFDAVARRGAGIRRNEVIAIKDWIAGGGHLIVLAPPYGSEYDTLLGIPSSRGAPNVRLSARPFAVWPVLSGITAVAGNYTMDFGWDAAPKAVPLLATDRGIVAMQYAFGKGSVIAFTDYGVFDNSHLGLAANARLAVQLARATSGPVAFDETVHGYAQNMSLWEALPGPTRFGIWIVVAAILVGLIGSAIRFAPPVVLERADERDSSAYITSMANLLAHARASRKALRDAADSALRGIRRSVGVSDRTPLQVFLSRVQNAEQRARVLELDRLRDTEHPTDAELVRAGVLSAQLRKDFSL